MGRKIIWRNNGWRLFKFGENHELIPKAEQTANMLKLKKSRHRHIIIKFLKLYTKIKILHAPREKQRITYRGTWVRTTVNFLTETMQDRRIPLH